MSDKTRAFKEVRPIAKMCGLSFEETVALLDSAKPLGLLEEETKVVHDKLMNQGLDASKAGTVLRDVLITFKKPMSKYKFTKEEKKILTDGGFTESQINDMRYNIVELNRFQQCSMDETLRTAVKALNTFELKK